MDYNKDNKMTDDKFILMGLDDERAGDIAEVLKNKTCKKILDHLAETKEASEKDISDALNLPLNTTEYNLGKLLKSGLVEKTKNFFWSIKGKKIPMYKLARKHIIISPSKNPSISALKTILPLILAALALVIILAFMFPKIEEKFYGNVSIIKPTIEETKLKHFSSYDELKNFINESYESGRVYGGVQTFAKTTAGAVPMAAETAGAEEFSTTNIQVEGVDEADIVKNDGKYIYVVTGNKVVIVEAYPAENMEILGEINISKNKNRLSVSEIFINEDKLIVFAQGYDYPKYKSLVYIYNVEDREEPKLEHEIEIDGNYIDSRMIGNFVYIIATKYVNIKNPEPPVYIKNGMEKKISAEEIYYWPYQDTSYVFTSIMAINVKNGDFESKVYLTGATATIYVSQDNIYLTYQRRMSYEEYYKNLVDEVYSKNLPEELKNKIKNIAESDEKNYYSKKNKIDEIVGKYSNSLKGSEKAEFDKNLLKNLEDFEKNIEKENEKTIIHKINVKKGRIKYEGVGEVPGHLLNQFSMDEYEGNFRIATTTGEVWGGNSLNHLYILDEELKIIGKVEDLAPGEKIYSTRFLGDRAYVVTFKKVDPLFVIDLSNPKKPEVLGYLKITGYSDYLHIYDENHIIGIGKETVAASDEEIEARNLQFAWYQGLKISLFDVSDVENPKEKAKIEIGDRGTESLALQDHKAFLFDKQKNLLVIPISLAEIDESKYQGEIPPTAYGERVWEGAYVLNINTEEISVRGKITHSDGYKPRYGPAEDEPIGATREINGVTWTKTGENKWKTNSSRYYNYEYEWSWTDERIDEQEGGINYKQYIYDYKYQIQRSLYMDNVLYTVSQAKIKANDLNTIDEIKSVKLSFEQEVYPYPLYETTKAV